MALPRFPRRRPFPRIIPHNPRQIVTYLKQFGRPSLAKLLRWGDAYCFLTVSPIRRNSRPASWDRAFRSIITGEESIFPRVIRRREAQRRDETPRHSLLHTDPRKGKVGGLGLTFLDRIFHFYSEDSEEGEMDISSRRIDRFLPVILRFRFTRDRYVLHSSCKNVFLFE